MTFREQTTKRARDRRFVVGASVVVVGLTAFLGGCSSDDSTSSTAAAAGASSSSTTAAGAPASSAAVGEDACARLAAGLTAAHVTGGAPEASGDQCRVAVTEADGVAASGSVQLSIQRDADSSAFENALADPELGDPATIDDLGDMAAVAADGSRTQLVVLVGDRLVMIVGEGVSSSAVEALARAAVGSPPG